MKIDDKTKELIAIGVSVALNCKPCLQYHYCKAKEADACDDGIADAVAVAKMVRRGAMSKTDEFTTSVLKNTPADVSLDENCFRV